MKVVRRTWADSSGQRGDKILYAVEICLTFRGAISSLLEKPRFILQYDFDTYPLVQEYYQFDRDGECMIAFANRNCTGRVWMNANCARQKSLWATFPPSQYCRVEIKFSRERDMMAFKLRFGDDKTDFF
jgi:hypothetical protein